MPITQEQYFKKPEESVEQYNTRIAGLQTPTATTPSGAMVNTVTGELLTPAPSTDYSGSTPTTPTMPAEPKPSDAATQPGKTEKSISDMIAEVTQMQEGLAGKETYRIGQEKQYGLEALQKSEAEYTDQFNQLQAEYKNIENRMQNQAEGRGITAGGLAPITMAEQRTVSMKANTVAALLAGTQSKMALAQQHIDKAVDDKFKQQEANIQTKLDNLALLMKDPMLTLEQQNRATQQTNILRQQQEKEAQKKEDSKQILNWATQAAANGATPMQAQEIANIGLSNNPDLQKAFELVSPFVRKPEENWSEPYLLGGDYVQKNSKTGEIRTAVNVPKGTDTTTPLSILDVARYNEIYPEAGITAGDTEATANAKVQKSTQPRDFTDEEIRTLVRDDKSQEKTYDEVIAAINAFPTLKNKERALLIASEIYGKAPKVPKKEVKSTTQTSTPVAVLPIEDQVEKLLFSPTI